MTLAGKNILEEGEDTWLLIGTEKMSDELPEVDKEVKKDELPEGDEEVKKDELPEVDEEVKKTPPVAASAPSNANNGDTTCLTMIVAATLFLLVLNMTYMFRGFIYTPSGASTFVVACLNALGAWSILNTASKSPLNLCQGG